MTELQDRINAIAAQVNTIKEQTLKALAEITAAIEELKNQGAELDFTVVDAALAAAAQVAQQLDDMVPDKTPTMLPVNLPSQLSGEM